MRLVSRLAHYVMSGRTQAIRVGLLFSVLPFVSWIANIVVALVTLRKGAKEGGLVLLWVLLPSVVLASASNPWIWIYSIVGYHCLGYILANVLRYSIDWAAVLECLLLIGLLVVMAVHLMFPEIQQIWFQYLKDTLAVIEPKWNIQLPDSRVSMISGLATGLQIAVLFISGLWNLLVARAIQAVLYNPNGLSSELGSIRLSFSLSSVILICMVASGLGDKIALDSLPIVILIGGLSGLSLLINFVTTAPFTRFWMFLIGMACIIFLPYMLYSLSIMAWVDSSFDLRKRWRQ